MPVNSNQKRGLGMLLVFCACFLFFISIGLIDLATGVAHMGFDDLVRKKSDPVAYWVWVGTTLGFGTIGLMLVAAVYFRNVRPFLRNLRSASRAE